MMLADIRASLARLVADYGQINPSEVEVRYEAPTREWTEGLTRPAINFYLFDLQDPTQMDPLLVEAIGYGLAAVLAIPLGRDKAMKQLMEQEREGRLAIARLVGSQENSPKEWDTDLWLRARR